MRIRDRVVVAVLAATGLLGWLVWHPVGAWASLLVLITGVLIAAAVYRVGPPALGSGHDQPPTGQRTLEPVDESERPGR